MSELMTISGGSSTPTSKIAMYKATSLQQQSMDLDSAQRQIMNHPLQPLFYHSEQEISHQDSRSRYATILKQIFCQNNFHKPQSSEPSVSRPETQKSYALTLRTLRRKVHKATNITALLKTQYPIIHNLIHKYFNYKFYNKEDHFNDIYLIWMDTYVSEQFVKRLKSYQKINHFPSSCELGRKDLLTLNIKTAQQIMKEEYAFYPEAWVLPKEIDRFNQEKSKEKIYIVKPHANCQGRGIYLTKNPIFSPKDEVIVQQYLQNPMLIDGHKFDLRIYVLLRSLNPLRIYIYREGLCRLATSKYTEPNDSNIKNDRMHLTNYAINKLDPNFISNKDIQNDHKGHKRSYTSVIKQLQKRGFDTDKIEERIESIVLRTILATYTKLLKSYKKSRSNNTEYSTIKDNLKSKSDPYQTNTCDYNSEQPSVCFELLGFDIMLLDTGEPILLEVNHQPSLVTDSPFDLAVKKSLVMDTINLLNIEEKDKEEWEKCQKEGLPYRNKGLDQKELQQQGAFKRIYPLSHIKYHDKSEEQIERVQNIKFFYEALINKFILREFRLQNKIKLSNYKTITSKLQTRIKSNQGQGNNDKAVPQSSDKSRNNKTSISENQKAVALTFYNLFNDAKYHIKRGNLVHQEAEENSPEYKAIRNHIYLASVDEDPKDERLIKQPHINKKNTMSPYQSSSCSPSRNKNKRDINVRQIQLISKQHQFDKEDNQKQQITVSALVSYQKFRENINSIRNRGIISYITSQPQTRRSKISERSSQLPEKKISKNECLQQSSSTSQSCRQDQKGVNRSYRQDRKQMLTSIVPEAFQLNDYSEGPYECKNGYTNLNRNKIERSSNLRLVRHQYQKLNFAYFLSKSKNKSRSKIIGDEISTPSTIASPSAQSPNIQ